MSGADLITSERNRQIWGERWTPEHDDQYFEDELARAAATYAMPARDRTLAVWPWSKEWWKPTPNDRIRELVKAGALIAADIDRLQRLQKV